MEFWYGDEENRTDLDHNYSEYTDLENNLTEHNTTHGTFAYVGGEDDSVYSFHLGKEVDRNYTWRIGEANGWRKLITPAGLGEFENASVGEVVWAKRMDDLVDVPMPDGRLRTQQLVDYVTMDHKLHPFGGKWFGSYALLLLSTKRFIWFH